MIGSIVLVALQFACAVLGAPYVLAQVPVSGDLQVFAKALVYAGIVWVVGLVGSFALKDVMQPGPRALVAAIVVACLGAAFTLWPQGMQMLLKLVKFPSYYLIIIGAIIGYQLRRG